MARTQLDSLTDNAFDTFTVGKPVHWGQGTDTVAGTVTRVTKCRIYVRRVEATLMNGSGSGEPDALHFEPGGFVGHTSGRQRWEFGEMEGPEIVFSRRNFSFREYDLELRQDVTHEVSIAKMQGTSMRGSMRSWGRLYHGHRAHYDFNF